MKSNETPDRGSLGRSSRFTARYLFFTTLWAFLLPGVIANGFPALLLIAAGFSDPALFVPGISVLAVCGLLLWGGIVLFLKRFSVNLRTGQVPKSFTLLILPFWIPLFWGFVMSIMSFYIAPTSRSAHLNFILLGFPQYFVPLVLTVIAGDIDFFVMAACVGNFFLAIVGTVYVFCLAPAVPKTRGLIFCTVITLLPGGLAVLSYNHFRAEVLPYWGKDRIVRDERGRQWVGSDTDLSEYVPFKENNKLVKIESPTLVIDSEHPRIHGAFALYPVYAAAVEAAYRDTGKMKFDPRHWDAEVTSGTSPDAFAALLSGESDMIFMLQPSEKQLQEAEAKGIELVMTPIGYEAFVFFVSTVNPVDGLSLDQIRDIYSKRITRWEEIGGKSERILPFQRPEGSGSQTMMLRVMGNVPIVPPQREEFRRGMGEIVHDVADYRNYGNAIGFSFRYYVEGLFKHEGVKLLKIDGIAPTIESIQNESYPLIGELVIISRTDNTNPFVPKLTEWFLSPQGQELVKSVGYVPL